MLLMPLLIDALRYDTPLFDFRRFAAYAFMRYAIAD